MGAGWPEELPLPINRGRMNWMGQRAGWRCPREACAFGEREGEGTLVWIAEPEGFAQRQH